MNSYVVLRMRSSMFNRRRSPLSSYLKAPNATPHVKHSFKFLGPKLWNVSVK